MQVESKASLADLTGVSSVKTGADTSGEGAVVITTGAMFDIPGSLSPTTEEVNCDGTTVSSCPICPGVTDTGPKSINWLASTEVFFSASSPCK